MPHPKGGLTRAAHLRKEEMIRTWTVRRRRIFQAGLGSGCAATKGPGRIRGLALPIAPWRTGDALTRARQLLQ